MSLLEVLIGVAVMVPLTLASVSGLMLGIKVSASTQLEQRMEVALTAAAEDLKAVPYLSCGTPKEYQSLLDGFLVKPVTASLMQRLQPTALRVALRDPSSTVLSVEYWDSANGRFRTKCNKDDGAQRLTVLVTRSDGSVEDSTTGTVVKRNALTRKAGTG